MKKIYLKRVLSITLAAVMTISAVGCGKKNSGNTGSDESDASTHNAKEYVYKEADIDLGADVDYNSINYLGKYGDKLYAAANSYTDSGMGFILYTFDKDGSNVEKKEINIGDNASPTAIDIADDGSVYYIIDSYGGSFYDGEIMPAEDGGMSTTVEEGTTSEDIEPDPASVEDDTTSDDTSSDEEAEDVEEEADTPDEPETPGAEDDSTISLEGDTVEEIDLEDLIGDSDGNIVLGGEGDYYEGGSDKYYLVKQNSDGTEGWKIQLNAKDEESYYYTSSLIVYGDKGVIVSDTMGIHVYNPADGSLIKDFDTSEYMNPDEGSTFNIYEKGNGDLVASFIASSSSLFYEMNFDSGKLTPVEGAELPAYDYQIFNGNENYDLLLSNSEAVYGYNIGDATPKMLMNFVDSDISAYGLYQIVSVSDKVFYCMLPTDEAYVISLLTKVDPSEVKDKKTITLGCNYIEYDVRSQVVKFNKASDEYRIVIQDYSKYDTEDDYTAGASRLNTDIVSGNVPDMLVLDNDMPIDSYVSKGLFQDMTDYFKNDPELSKNEYLEHIMEVFKNNGKMYKIIPSFYVETVLTGAEDAPDGNTWTINDLEEAAKKKNVEYKNIFGPSTRSDIFNMALRLTGSQFIDWDTLKCSYNSEEFIHLLEFVNEFPESIDEEELYNTDTSTFWRENKSIAESIYLNGFSDFNYEAKGTFGKDVSLVGFPSGNGSGAAIFPSFQLTVSASSKVKDGCWEFLRFFLSDEYQKTIDTAWPVSMKYVNALADAAKKRPTYTDENGKEVEYDDTWYVGEQEVIITPMTDDEVKQVIGYFDTLNQLGTYNDAVDNIISEEADAYFSGQKSAEEVADIIQSRVQIYVNEIS